MPSRISVQLLNTFFDVFKYKVFILSYTKYLNTIVVSKCLVLTVKYDF